MYGYLDIQALIGISKHPGGLIFTRRLLAQLGVGAGSTLLYVGVGNGAAPARIVELTHCSLTGIDTDPRMLDSAARYESRDLELVAASAESLPFASNSYDAVISESVTAFTVAERALREYRRVLKPGAGVGLNEMTWLTAPTAEMERYAADLLDGLVPRTREGWIDALSTAGFGEISADTGSLKSLELVKGEMQMIDRHALDTSRRFFSLAWRDPAFRASLWRLARGALAMPKGFLRGFGYGLYVARKPVS